MQWRCGDRRIQADQPLGVIAGTVPRLCQHTSGQATGNLGPGLLGDRIFHDPVQGLGRRLGAAFPQMFFDVLPRRLTLTGWNVALTR